MFIKSFKLNKKIFTFVLLIIFILVSISIFYSLADNENQKEKKDDYINQGQVIGKSGTNELDKEIGNHLHLEIYENGNSVNPENYLNKEING